MNRTASQPGFTLLELVIVLVILSVVLTVSLPLFNIPGQAPPGPRKELNTLIRVLTSLKQQAVEQEKTFFLHISPSGTKLWLTDSAMDASAKEQAMDEAFETFKSIRISRISLPGTPDPPSDTLCFFKRGYSDMAILRVEGLDAPVFVKIEPFLSGIQSLDDLQDLHDCT